MVPHLAFNTDFRAA